MTLPQVVRAPELQAAMDFVGGLALPNGNRLVSCFKSTPWVPELLEALLDRTPGGLPASKITVLDGPRGCGKTSLLAAWLLTEGFRQPGLDARCIAVDIEQAGLAIQVLRGFLGATPKLSGRTAMTEGAVRFSNGSRIAVLASDIASSFGLGVGSSLAVGADEWTLWNPAGERLFESLLGSVVKLPAGQMLLTGTAGLVGSWQEELWGALQADPEVKVVHVKELPPWVSEKDVSLAERLLPDSSFRRFFKSEWVSAASSFVSGEEWDALVEADAPGLGPTGKIVLALDAGLVRDTFAAVATSRDPRAPRDSVLTRVVQVWEAPPRGRIDFGEVKQWVLAYVRANPVAQVAFDPWQLQWLATEIADEGRVWCCPFDQGSQREEADTQLQHLIRNGRLHHGGNPVLRQHILASDFRISLEGSKGRLKKRSEKAPIDSAVALSMSAHQCMYLYLDP